MKSAINLGGENMHRQIAITLAILNVMWVQTSLAAPAIPNPQEELQESIPNNDLSVNFENETPTVSVTDNSEKFYLRKMIIDTDIKFRNDNAELQHIVSKYTNNNVGLAELRSAIGEVTLYFRGNGYPAATAYLPPQDVENGIVHIGVELGKFGEIIIDNKSHIKTSVIERLTKNLRRDDIIRVKKLESSIYNIIGLGGVKAGAIMRPGSQQGITDIVVKVEDGKRDSYILYAENHGSESAGRYRYGFSADWYEMTGIGDHFSANVLISNKKQHNYGAKYDLSVGKNGTRLGIGFSNTDYELGRELSSLGATGRAHTYSLFGNTPLWRTSTAGMNISYGWDYRNMRDEMRSIGYSVKKHSNALHLGINGFQQYTKTLVTYDLTGYVGNLTSEDAHIAGIPLTVEPQGHYNKVVLNASAVQTFNKEWDLLVRFQGQQAGTNLDSSEKIYLGGANAVRAYPQGEGSGDNGYQATAELRYHTKMPDLVLSTYLDIGHVKYIHDGTIPGNKTLKGWGIGLTWSRPNDFFARLDYARRIGLADNATDDAKSKQRIWFQLGKIW